jgi:hypothetical protein
VATIVQDPPATAEEAIALVELGIKKVDSVRTTVINNLDSLDFKIFPHLETRFTLIKFFEDI